MKCMSLVMWSILFLKKKKKEKNPRFLCRYVKKKKKSSFAFQGENIEFLKIHSRMGSLAIQDLRIAGDAGAGSEREREREESNENVAR